MRPPFAETGVRPHITVWLDETDDSRLKEFRCNVCGKVVFEHYGRIDKLIPGKAYQEDEEQPFLKSGTVHMCGGSVERFTPITHDYDAEIAYHEQEIAALKRKAGTVRRERCGTKYWICK